MEKESVTIDIDVPSVMRDGTILYADVYRPADEAKHPVVLTRLPYGKGSGMVGGYMNPLRFVRAGYAVVIQDIRGTGASEGEFYPRVAEMDDGYDTVEWAAVQPWSDGNVGMYGMSHLGFTQWAAAVTRPPHLKTICPMATQAGARPFNHGALRLNHILTWASIFPLSELGRKKVSPEKARSLRKRIIDYTNNINDLYWVLPLKDVPSVGISKEMGLDPYFYADYLEHNDDRDFWKKSCSPADYEDVDVPALHICGWYDILTDDVIDSYVGMKARAGSPLARSNQKLILGPWIHTTEMQSVSGDLDFGLESSGNAADITGVHIRWFDRWLKGIDNGIMEEPRVRIFTMGENKWRNECDWPLPNTVYTPYYFHSAGNANSRCGDGALTTLPPEEEPADAYMYNPRDPVPAKPGGPGTGVIMGAYDFQEIELRKDMLVYSTPPLINDIEVTGTVKVKLFASSSASDTDFVGKLVDVYPDGRAYNLVDGIVRARYRKTEWHAELIEPGKVYEYTLELGATSNLFQAGHRIRLEIASSSFPKWDRNPNTGHKFGQDAEMESAAQKVFHNAVYPSHVLLPVIPERIGDQDAR